MSISVIGGQSLSISHSGVALFEQGVISSGMGGVVIDLASAPIPPGDYTLEIEVAMGGVEIYLPRYVQFTIDGTSVFGGRDVHEGVGWWNGFTHKMKSLLHLTDEIPQHAVENAHPDQPVNIRFVLNVGMGGVDIYRL